jgi:hypothetical protein
MTYITQDAAPRWIMAFYAAYGLSEHSSAKLLSNRLKEYFVENSMVAGFTTLCNTCVGLTDRIFLRTISNEEEPMDVRAQLTNLEVTHEFCQAMLFGKPVIDATYSAVASIIQSGDIQPNPNGRFVPVCAREWCGNLNYWKKIRKPIEWRRPAEISNTFDENTGHNRLLV